VLACATAGYRVCLYSNERRRHLLLRCLQAGAQGVVHKAEPTETLADALFQVAAGAVVITTGLIGLAELAERREQLPTLTDRQRQVLSGRARGETFRSIARRLTISEKTAQEHWSVVTEKFAGYLRTHSAADLERLLGLDTGELFPAGDELSWWRQPGR
jgi:two-component system nitrate/nitrite response regulator NarL